MALTDDQLSALQQSAGFQPGSNYLTYPTILGSSRMFVGDGALRIAGQPLSQAKSGSAGHNRERLA